MSVQVLFSKRIQALLFFLVLFLCLIPFLTSAFRIKQSIIPSVQGKEGTYNLKLKHELPGNLRIISAPPEKKLEEIQIEASSDKDEDQVQVEINEEDNGEGSVVRIGFKQPNSTDNNDELGSDSSSAASSILFPSLWSSVLLACTAPVYGGLRGEYGLLFSTVAIGLSLSMYTAIAEEEPHVDIQVTVPSNVKLNILDISITQGTIEIDDSISYYPQCNIEDSETCPSCCSGNGQCTSNGCQCSAGFQGSDCSESQPSIVNENSQGLPENVIVHKLQEFNGETFLLADSGLYVKIQDGWKSVLSGVTDLTLGEYGLFSISPKNTIHLIYNSTHYQQWDNRSNGLPRGSSTVGVGKGQIVVQQDNTYPNIVRLNTDTGEWENLDFPNTKLDGKPHTDIIIGEDGSIWYESNYSGVFKFNGDSWSKATGTAPKWFSKDMSDHRTPAIEKKNLNLPSSSWKDISLGLPSKYTIHGFGEDRDGFMYASIENSNLNGVYKFDGQRWWHIAHPVSKYGTGSLFSVNGEIYVSGHNSLHHLDRSNYSYIHTGKFLGKLDRLFPGNDRVFVLNGGTQDPQILEIDLNSGKLNDLEFSFSNLDGKPHVSIQEDKKGRVWYSSNYSGVFILSNGIWEKASENSGALSISLDGTVYFSYEVVKYTQISTFFRYEGKENGKHKWKQIHTDSGYGIPGTALNNDGAMFFSSGRFNQLIIQNTKKWTLPWMISGLNLTSDETKSVRTHHFASFQGAAMVAQNYEKEGVEHIRIVGLKPDLSQPYYDSNLTIDKEKSLMADFQPSESVGVHFTPNENIIAGFNTKDTTVISEPLSLINTTSMASASTSSYYGIIFILSPDASSTVQAYKFSTSILDFSCSENEMVVVAHHGGLTKINFNNGNIIWDQSISSTKKRVSISGSYVAFLSSNDKIKILNYDDGSEYWSKTIQRSYIEDVEISQDFNRVFVVGFDNKNLPDGNPVQVAFLTTYDLSGEFQYQLFGFDGQDLSSNIADTRLYRCTMSLSGNLLILGESAGSQTIFRYDGRSYDGNEFVSIIDFYNALWNTKSAHIAYHAKIDPKTGDMIRSQLTMSRLSSGVSNTFRVGDIAGNENGENFVVGRNNAYLANRAALTLNDESVSEYAGGDPSFLRLASNYDNRLSWHPLTTNSQISSSGFSRAIDVINEKAVILVDLEPETADSEDQDEDAAKVKLYLIPI